MDQPIPGNLQTLGRDLGEFQTNPAAAWTQLLSDIGGLFADEFGHAIEAIEAYLPQLIALAVTLPAGAAGGLASLTALAAIQPETPLAAAPPPVPQAPSLPAATVSPPVIAASAAAPAPSSAPASASATASAAPRPGAPPPPPGVVGGAFPYLVGGPTVGGNTAMSSSAQRKAPEPDSAAAAAAATALAREAQRARRRRAGRDERPAFRGYRYEFLDADANARAVADSADDWGGSPHPSDRGAGPLGFAGSVAQGGRPRGRIGHAGRGRVRGRAASPDDAGRLVAGKL